MAITQITNYELLSTARLISQFRKKAKFEGWVTAYAARVQELEDALWALYSLSLDTATYAQLELYGAIVGEDRLGSTDTAYRKRIKARVRINRSSGTCADLYAVALLLCETGTVFEFEESYPCNFELRATGVSNDTSGELIATAISETKAAGVRGVFIWQADTDANTFTFDGTAQQGWDSGIFARGSEG